MAPSKQGISVRVNTPDTELEFKVLPKTTGKQLFEQVIQAIGIREIWYFGLQFTDSRGNPSWLNLEKKLKEQDIKKENPLEFKFKFKYFPEQVPDEIIQESTLQLLYVQIKKDILSGAMYSPPEKAVLLASYAVQVKYGVYNPETHASGFLANDNILPKSIISEHKLSREEWEDKVMKFYMKTEYKSLTPEDAMMNYLKIAQDLETYGITYYEITNKKGTDLVLGVDCLGVNVYDKGDKFSPKISFPWSEINRISYQGDNFIIKCNDKKSPKFVGVCKIPKDNKKIYDLATGNHEMYMRRRRPDSIEIQQMKSQKQSEMEAKAKAKSVLNIEIAARAKAERMRQEMEEKYRKMEEDMQRREKQLNEAEERIARLEEQLKEISEAKEELEQQQAELREMMTQLEEAKNMEASEREKLTEEIRAKQEEIDSIQKTVNEKEEETRRLQDEVETSKKLMESQESNKDIKDSDNEETTYSAESIGIPEIIVDPVEDREVDMDANMSADLAELGESLKEARDEGKETDETKSYRENVKQGTDKYKTLREVRKGNTKRRIDVFENL